MLPTTSSAAVLHPHRFTEERTESSTLLECSCGAIFERRRSRTLSSRTSPNRDGVDPGGRLMGAASYSSGSMFAICPSCGAEQCFESSGYPVDYRILPRR
jgi:hypothetical protein